MCLVYLFGFYFFFRHFLAFHAHIGGGGGGQEKGHEKSRSCAVLPSCAMGCDVIIAHRHV